MKNRWIVPVILVSLVTLLTACEIIGGIFKVGMGVGIFLTVAIVVVVLFLLNKIGRR